MKTLWSSNHRRRSWSARKPARTRQALAELLEPRLAPATGSISGVVFNDVNGNGTQDSGDLGVSGRTVYVDLNQDGQLDSGDPTTTTAADGSYTFSGLAPGNYLVDQVLPGGWHQSTPTPTLARLVSVVDTTPHTFTFASLSSTSDQTIPAYHENGFTFNTNVAQPTIFRVYGSSNAVRYAGAPALTAQWVPATISLSRDDGGAFNLNAMDLSTIWSSIYNVTVSFTGHRADGSTVQQSFPIGSQLGFHTATFTGFTNLTSVTWSTSSTSDYHQFNNVSVSTGGPLDVAHVDFGSVSTGSNTRPAALGPTYGVSENTTLNVGGNGLLTATADVDHDPLAVIVTTPPAHGTLTLSPLGPFSYVPNTNFFGTDTFQFVASDGALTSLPATVTINVQKLNHAPAATNDAYTVTKGTALTVDAASGVLANDSDADSDPLTAKIVSYPTHGSLQPHADGSFTYTPLGQYLGPDRFSYKANDGTVDSNTATVSLNVTGTDDPPVAVDNTYAVAENAILNIFSPGVLGNDSDPNGQTLTASLVNNPSHGTLTFGSNGSFKYTPSTGYHGSDTFQYQVSDGQLSSAATVTITVDAPPVTVAESYATNEDTPLTIAAPGVLANDTQSDGNPLQALVSQYPSHGTLRLQADGSFTYTPALHYSGTDQFKYYVNDGVLNGPTVTDTINVQFVNHAPVAGDDSYTIAQGGTLSTVAASTSYTAQSDPGDYIGGGASYSDSATDGTYTVWRNYDNGVSIRFVPTVNPIDSWSLDFVAPNNATLTPGVYNNATRFPFQSSGVPGLSVTYYDRGSNTLTGSFTVYQADYDAQGHVLSFDASFVQHSEGGTAALNGRIRYRATGGGQAGVLFNDTDVENDPLTAQLVAGPSHGSLAFNADGTFTYTPNPSYAGPDLFTYRASDGVNLSNIGTVALTVTAANHAPLASNDSYSAIQNTPLTVAAPGVLGNDSDPDGNPITASKVAGPSHGTLTLNADGSFTYTPATDYLGPDSFTYQVSDGTLTSDPATVSLMVGQANHPPMTTDQSISAVENQPSAIVLGASDLDGDTLSYTIVSAPSHGALSGTAPNLAYTPASGYFGADSFTFKANDGKADSNVSTVSILVDAPPTSTGAALTTVEDTPAAVALASTDAEGDGLSYSIVTTPAHGTLSGTAPNLTYTPASGYFGADSFTFKANDGTVDSNVATITILVDAPPTANDVSVRTLRSQPVPISISADDPESDALTYAIVTAPAHGTLSGTAPNLTYTPASGYFGTDSFTFKANDGTVDSNVATVSLVIDAPPTSSNLTLKAVKDVAASLTLEASDAEGDALTYAIMTAPGHGTLSGTAPNLTYTPAPGFFGADSFTYTANDGTADSNEATVSIVVDAPPTANGGSLTTVMNTALGVTLEASDPEGDSLTYTIVTPPVHGTLSGTAPNLTYTPAPGYFGADGFTFKANDGTVDSNVAAVSLGVAIPGTSTLVTASSTTSTYGGPLSITATVSALAPSMATPTGTVQFQVDGANLGLPVSLVDGVATLAMASPLPAGHHAITTVYASGDGTFTGSQGDLSGGVSVGKASLTITADSLSRAYGAANPALTVVYAGFIPGETAANLLTPVNVSTSASSAGHVGDYPITPSGATSDNYAIQFVDGTLHVTPVPLTATADDLTKLYGAATPDLTVHFSGFVNGDTSANLSAQPVLTSSVTNSSHVGSDVIAIAGAADPDYTITQVPGTFTVTPAPLSIVADSTSKIFGAPLPPLTASFSGFVNGDSPASLTTPVALTTTATATSPPGSYPITVTAADPDYAITLVSGTLSITRPVVGDYNGDARTDFALYDRSPSSWTGVWHIPNVTSPAGLPFGGSRVDIPVQGDFNGDGKTEIAVYRPSTGQWFIAGMPTVRFGQANVSIPVPGNYDGLGVTQLAVYQPNTGQWFIAGHAQPLSMGISPQPGDIPVPADYNGDGRTDIAIYRPKTAQWFTGVPQPIRFGGPNDVPVPGDYDGLGHAELALYRPKTAQWFVGGHAQPVRFGGPGDVPVPGDYDGLGHTQYALYRPGTGQWFIGGHAQAIHYGGPHLVPAAAPYAYRALSGKLSVRAVVTAPASTVTAGATSSGLSSRSQGSATPAQAAPAPKAAIQAQTFVVSNRRNRPGAGGIPRRGGWWSSH